jgi:hypothetical protein
MRRKWKAKISPYESTSGLNSIATNETDSVTIGSSTLYTTIPPYDVPEALLTLSMLTPLIYSLES